MTLSACHAEMLASDLSEAFCRYGINVSGEDVAPELADLVARVTANAAKADEQRWESRNDAARWTPAAAAPSEPVPQHGEPPEMTYFAWHESQGVELGAQGVREHFWRCPICRTWAGPYEDVQECKKVGMAHRFDQHDRPAALRTEARRAARRLGGPEMKAREFDAMVKRVGEASALSADTVHRLVVRTESAVQGRSSVEDLVGAIVRDDVVGDADTARRAVLELGGPLLCAQWLERMGL